MILVDTSVWIAHLREKQPVFADLLSDGQVLLHPCVSGELACGNLSKRAVILSDLQALPAAAVASDTEVMRLIENRGIWGRGLGWVDAHLLASALISNCQLWTFDKRLAKTAAELALS